MSKNFLILVTILVVVCGTWYWESQIKSSQVNLGIGIPGKAIIPERRTQLVVGSIVIPKGWEIKPLAFPGQSLSWYDLANPSESSNSTQAEETWLCKSGCHGFEMPSDVGWIEISITSIGQTYHSLDTHGKKLFPSLYDYILFDLSDMHRPSDIYSSSSLNINGHQALTVRLVGSSQYLTYIEPPPTATTSLKFSLQFDPKSPNHDKIVKDYFDLLQNFKFPG